MPLNRRAFVKGSAIAAGAFAAGQALTGEAATPALFTDALFKDAFIDKDEWRDKPVRHRYVHGGFTGTDARFTLYFPDNPAYQGRFFQLITPVPVSENSSEGDVGEADYIGFALSSGAYFVRSNQGGILATGSPGSPVDGSIAGYRVSAATAEYSRTLALKMYGGKRPFGYCFGGSGGSYRTIGGFENTEVWDGAVPFVIGIPHSIPTMFTIRLHALRLVGDRFAQIVDAVEPGGSGDIYKGLSAEAAAGLREATLMGFPPRTWFLYKEIGWGPFSNLFDLIVQNDPGYFEDFWKVPGYLGADPPPSLKAARLQHRTIVKRVVMSNEAAALNLPAPVLGYKDWRTNEEGWQKLQDRWAKAPIPVGFQLETPPPGAGLQGAKIIVRPGKDGSVSVGALYGDIIMVLFTPVGGPQTAATAGVKAGDTIQVDNSDTLAVQTIHRHILPPPDYYGWNQFRGPDGKPLYPQRQKLLGPQFAIATAGSLQSGRFKGKMIVVQSLMDEDALPWQGDWYRNKVRENFGARTDDVFRLWFTDCALHVSTETGNPTRTVNYRGMLHQALRDVATWVERGVPPPQNSSYRIEQGAQVVLAPDAKTRKGIQPMVRLTANGGARANVKVGQPVSFVGTIEAPPRAGMATAARWDLDGSGKLVDAERFQPAPRVELRATHSYTAPGTYFVTFRGSSQRDGDATTPYARLDNLARARVVVT